MKDKFGLSVILIASLGASALLADVTTPDDARKQATDNAAILYKSADPNDSTSWSFYFGPSEQEAATSPVANSKRQIMQSYFLNNKFPDNQVQRNVNWLFDASAQMQMYNQGVVPVNSDSSTSNNYGY